MGSITHDFHDRFGIHAGHTQPGSESMPKITEPESNFVCFPFFVDFYMLQAGLGHDRPESLGQLRDPQNANPDFIVPLEEISNVSSADMQIYWAKLIVNSVIEPRGGDFIFVDILKKLGPIDVHLIRMSHVAHCFNNIFSTVMKKSFLIQIGHSRNY
jgi:hypothetical protein